MIQGSDAWLLTRCGKITASRVNDLMPSQRGKYYASRGHLMRTIAIERITGEPVTIPSNEYMEWGKQTEPQAREHYRGYAKIKHRLPVREIGFVDHTSIPMAGASPDGLVGLDGLVEIKCPMSKTHRDTLFNKRVPDKYQNQILWQMACTGRWWCDFVTFDPRIEPEHKFLAIYFERDDKRIKTIEEEVIKFQGELEAALPQYRRDLQVAA